jgi:hypothetical protein
VGGGRKNRNRNYTVCSVWREREKGEIVGARLKILRSESKKERKYAKDKRKLIILSRNFTFSCCCSELPLYAGIMRMKENEWEGEGGGEDIEEKMMGSCFLLLLLVSCRN